MAAQKEQVPAVEGWFTLDDEPALLGLRCTTCSTVLFPPRAAAACPNPGCRGTEFAEQPLSRTGRIWSYTTNHYAPPEPYIAADPFEPVTVAAVELAEERIVVLGQVVRGVNPADLSVGDEVELTVGVLFSDDDHDYMTWQWAPGSHA
jgi:uncharacterized protein